MKLKIHHSDNLPSENELCNCDTAPGVPHTHPKNICGECMRDYDENRGTRNISKPVGEWEKHLITKINKILRKHYKNQTRGYLQITIDLKEFIDSLLSVQKQDSLEKLELIKDDLERAIVRYGDRQLVRDTMDRIKKIQKSL